MVSGILLIVVAAYALELLVLYNGMSRSTAFCPGERHEPPVSVIVAARNEEQYIADCIDSLLRIEYPADKLEIIVVNDQSTDRTPELIRDFTSKWPHVKMITSVPGAGNLRGKSNALNQGIEASRGEILMFTDADCRVQPGWVKETVRYFSSDTGIVGGYTLLDANSAFEGMQTLDWIFLFNLASGTAGINRPLTVIGNNLSIRKTAYDQAGGLKNINFSVTEDYALVRAVLNKTGYKVRFPCDKSTLIFSKACQNGRQLFRQKQRWGVGGLDMIPFGLIVMLGGYLARLAILVSIFFLSFETLIFLAVMALAEFLFILRPLIKFKSLRYLKYFPAFIIYFFFYPLLLPLVAVMSKNVVWKERQLKQ